ncbi:flagellar FliJ family protein [uncultured Nocardioides sp.]|uniref:flagellar FliJ family protein n=1 Tax=uncultured Nocardioides sp. TaxID=198441 RepID=UPI0025EAF219|nr:flagellar FliJ family protein [uncultured Nocardioides sp.]
MSTVHDAGLQAVARVRGVRERDSRQGLTTAIAEHAAVESGVRTLEQQLDAQPAFLAGTSVTYLADRTHALAVGQALVVRREDLRVSASVMAAATSHWRSDRSRLEAVSMLLARRAEQRRAERARTEAAQLDDAAAQGWLRRRTLTEEVRA